jgi:hypothetical protein
MDRRRTTSLQQNCLPSIREVEDRSVLPAKQSGLRLNGRSHKGIAETSKETRRLRDDEPIRDLFTHLPRTRLTKSRKLPLLVVELSRSSIHVRTRLCLGILDPEHHIHEDRNHHRRVLVHARRLVPSAHTKDLERTIHSLFKTLEQIHTPSSTMKLCTYNHICIILSRIKKLLLSQEFLIFSITLLKFSLW